MIDMRAHDVQTKACDYLFFIAHLDTNVEIDYGRVNIEFRGQTWINPYLPSEVHIHIYSVKTYSRLVMFTISQAHIDQ